MMAQKFILIQDRHLCGRKKSAFVYKTIPNVDDFGNCLRDCNAQVTMYAFKQFTKPPLQIAVVRVGTLDDLQYSGSF